jgi:hypothetical protein
VQCLLPVYRWCTDGPDVLWGDCAQVPVCNRLGCLRPWGVHFQPMEQQPGNHGTLHHCCCHNQLLHA